MMQKNGSSDTITINKTDSVNFVFYSFTDKSQKNLEPDKSKYDIIFCPYYDLATDFGVTIPYLVRGVLLNVNQTQGLLDSTETYSQINVESLSGLNFLKQRDVIGYKWKSVNVDISNGTAAYTIKRLYLYTHLTQGNDFKMHFLSYMLDDSSGFPQFEYLQLK